MAQVIINNIEDLITFHEYGQQVTDPDTGELVYNLGTSDDPIELVFNADIDFAKDLNGKYRYYNWGTNYPSDGYYISSVEGNNHTINNMFSQGISDDNKKYFLNSNMNISIKNLILTNLIWENDLVYLFNTSGYNRATLTNVHITGNLISTITSNRGRVNIFGDMTHCYNCSFNGKCKTMSNISNNSTISFHSAGNAWNCSMQVTAETSGVFEGIQGAVQTSGISDSGTVMQCLITGSVTAPIIYLLSHGRTCTLSVCDLEVDDVSHIVEDSSTDSCTYNATKIPDAFTTNMIAATQEEITNKAYLRSRGLSM